MSNFRLKDPDCVLIHMPKTGGTAIRKGVWKGNYDPPVFGTIPTEWQDLFKFAFVRHPFDRIVSAWKMFTDGPIDDPSWKVPDAYPLSLEEFFNIVADDRINYDQRRRTFEERIRHHTIPQVHPFNCLNYADFVGRFERLEADFAIIAKRLRLNVTLEKIHYTDHDHWSLYVNGDLREKCFNYYKEDFMTLNYSPRH